MEFHGLGRRRVEAGFDGGEISSDGGVLLLREVGERLGLFDAAAACFIDHRDQRYVHHSVKELLTQRVLAIACGYEDLNDHDDLRLDPLMSVAVGKGEPRPGQLASPSTLNRLERTSPDDREGTDRYRRISCDTERMKALFLDLAISRFDGPPERIILDLDATDALLYGNQEGKHYHGYYKGYCYLPLYTFWGDFPLVARLKTADIDAADGAIDDVAQVVAAVRSHWPDVEIWVRGDSGFCRDDLLVWCEENEIRYVIGLPKNRRLNSEIADHLQRAKAQFDAQGDGEPVRIFHDFEYSTLKSWSRNRRVIAKAEHIDDKPNPRFVVTNLPKDETARQIYEVHYSARGNMENRIKEQQLDMFADRNSSATFAGNQMRLWFSTLAYALVAEFRRVGLAGTDMYNAQAGTIRTKLIKVGAAVRISVRRVRILLSENHPYKNIFAEALTNLDTRLPRLAA